MSIPLNMRQKKTVPLLALLLLSLSGCKVQSFKVTKATTSATPGVPSAGIATPSVSITSATTMVKATLADTSVTSVSLYSDGSCSTLIGSGTRAQLITTGISATTNLSNQITVIYAKVQGSSACTALATFKYWPADTFSGNYASPTALNACDGTQSTSVALVAQSCVGANTGIVDDSKCASTSTVSQSSPAGTINVAITHGTRVDTCGVGTAIVTSSNYVCNPGYINTGSLSGSQDTACSSFNITGGDVVSLAADGIGGFYLGGTFTGVNGVSRSYLARVDSSWNLSSWNPSPNGSITTMLVNNGTLYVAGNFTTVASGGTSRGYGAAYTVSTGAITSWDPGANAVIRTMTNSLTHLFIGGDFTSASSLSRSRLAAYQLSDMSVTSYAQTADASVYALQVIGTQLFIGGTFSHMDSAVRLALAATDISSASPASWALNVWAPTSHTTQKVSSFAAYGSTLFVSGNFTFSDTINYVRYVAYDASSVVTSGNSYWDFSTSTSGIDVEPTSLSVVGSKLYITGLFTSVLTASRTYMASLDATTRAVTSFNPIPNGATNATTGVGSYIVIGGAFTTMSGAANGKIAVFDSSGTLQ